MLTKEQVTDKVFWYFRINYKSLKDAAKELGCTSAYLSAMQTGARSPSKEILDKLGIEKKTIYVEK